MLNIENGFGAIALDQQQQLDREQGYAVIPTSSGLGTECEVTVNSGTLGNSDTIQVNSGDILVDGSVVSVSQQNAQIDVSNLEPRKDVVYLDATGTVQVKKGVPANAKPSGNERFQTYTPSPYDMHDIDGVVVSVVWVPADSGSIISSDLRDRRLPANKDVNKLNAQTVNAENLRTNSRASPVIVHYDGSDWVADGASTEIARNADGGSVINTALSTAGTVHVVPEDGGTTLSTSTTIDHTSTGKTLILQNGLRLQYTGSGTAIEVGGNPSYLQFDKIDANGADYGIKDSGLGIGWVRGEEIVNAASRSYYVDAGNYSGGANAQVEISFLNCDGGEQTTPVGFEVPSPSAGQIEGYTWNIDVIYHPTDKGFVIGDGSQGVRYHTVRTDIDASSGGATVLGEVWDEYNHVQVEGYIRSAGNRDIIIGPQAKGSRVDIQEASGSRLRVRRETPYASITRPIDKIGESYIEFDTGLGPESLDGFETAGDVSLSSIGSRVEQNTGSTSGDRANVRNWSDYDYSLATFDNYSILQSQVNFQDNTNQTGYVIHGDRGGQGYGFKVVDDTIKNWTHDGTTETTSVANSSFSAGSTFNLVALFNGPDNCVFWIDGTKVGKHSSNLPSGTSAANQWSIDFQTNEAEAKEVRWTNWRGKIIKT